MKGVSPMKEKIFPVLQKVAAIFFACLMLLLVIPVGLFPSDAPDTEGEVIRLDVAKEVFSAETENGAAKISRTDNGYIKFDLEQFSEIPVNEIKSAKLRLVFLKGGKESCVSVCELPGGYVTSNVARLVAVGKTLAELYPKTNADEDSLSEVDLTEHIKEKLKSGETEITATLSADAAMPAYLALSKHSDASYRPVLKIVTGTAEDTAPTTLKKSELRETATVSENDRDTSGRHLSGRNNILTAGGGREIYLKFDLVENSVIGEVKRAILSLNKLNKTESGAVRVYCINNDEWTADTITYDTRPRGEERQVPSTAVTGSGRINLDVTQAICEARSRGITTLTIRIKSADGNPIRFSGYGDYKTRPRLYLDATDDADTVCVAEAALYALGNNKAKFVTMNLADSHTAENGKTAKIRWTEYDLGGFEKTGRHIKRNGDVTRPKWFVGDVEVIAEAEISCGDYKTIREFMLTISAKAAPDYSGYKFSNYIDIGDSGSEKEQRVEISDTSSSKLRWSGANFFRFRKLYDGGAMSLNFACDGSNVNYLTLKLWTGDEQKNRFVISVPGADLKPIALNALDYSTSEESGFIYATYALPREYTDGKNILTLKLSVDGGHDESRGIYAAYLTQSPFFNPAEFAKQGEKSIGEPYFGEETIKMFIKNLRSVSMAVELDETEEAESMNTASRSVILKPEMGAAVFTGEDVNIAFAINAASGTAAIYQRSEYFDRYTEGCPVTIENGTLGIDYGDYKLVWNMTNEEKNLPLNMADFSGLYKTATDEVYYSFSEDWQMTDALPEVTTVQNGREIVIPPQNAMLFIRIDESMSDLENTDDVTKPEQ